MIFLNSDNQDWLHMRCPCCGAEMDQFEKNEKTIKFKCKRCGLTDTQVITNDKNSTYKLIRLAIVTRRLNSLLCGKINCSIFCQLVTTCWLTSNSYSNVITAKFLDDGWADIYDLSINVMKTLLPMADTYRQCQFGYSRLTIPWYQRLPLSQVDQISFLFILHTSSIFRISVSHIIKRP
jgi:DNA-directed RNA polymerase subunit RPC12/RpoP